MYRHSLLVSLVLWILAATVAFTQAAPKQINGGKPVEIVIQGLRPMTDAFDVNAKAEVAVARAFTKQYPNVSLKPFTFLQVPGGGQGTFYNDTNTLMSMAAGIAPDVIQTNFRQSDTYIRQGFLRPLDDFIEQWKQEEGGKAEMEQVFRIPATLEVAQRKGPDKFTPKNYMGQYNPDEKHIWALPPQTLVLVMLRRKDVLAAAGVNADHPPKDWNEFYEMCLQVTDPRPGKEVAAYVLSSTWFMSYMLWSAGSDILGPDPNDPNEWVAKYNDESAVRAFQFAWLLQNGPWAICPDCDKHYSLLPPGTNYAKFDYSTIKLPFADDAMTRCPKGHQHSVKTLKNKKHYFEGVCTRDYNRWGLGKVAFYISYMGDMNFGTATLDPALISIARVPADPITGACRAEVNSTMLAINGTVTDQAKVDAAWEYIKFRSSKEAKKIMTKVYVDSGYAKFINPEWLKEFGYDDYLRETQPGWEEMFRSAMAVGKPEPYGKNAQQIYNEMDIAWGEISMLASPDQTAIKNILESNVIKTNERLIGKLLPAEEKKRKVVAGIVVAIILFLFALLFRHTMAAYGHALTSENLRSKAAMRQVIFAWIIMLPALAAVCLFQYYPLARGSLIAFQDYKIVLGGTFVGLENFGTALFNEQFWASLGYSLKFASIALSLGFIAPVILALLLHEIPRGSLFFRIVYYLPSVTSGIVVMLLWMQIYDPNPYGLLNQVLGVFGADTQSFLQDPNLALFWVILPSIWMGVGPGCIIYLAALQQIPTDYYEAADVDGAGIFSKLKNITLPFLKPLLIINFVGACIGAMRSFEPVWIMTGGGPAGKTLVLGLYIWQNSFMYLKYGIATSMGWLMASLLIGFTMFQLRYLSKVQFRLAKSD